MKKADVSFEKHRASVTYDPKVTTTEALVKVVASARTPMGGSQKFHGRVHRGE